MAKKTFPYSVIWNGEIIPANTPIETEDKEPVTEEKTVEEKTTETAVKKNAKGTNRKA